METVTVIIVSRNGERFLERRLVVFNGTDRKAA